MSARACAGAEIASDRMPIERLLQQGVFEPETLAIMTAAYERALTTLGLTSRTDPATTLLAQTVIAVVESGVRDPDEVYRATLHAFKGRND
jgi:hypothetical protein